MRGGINDDRYACKDACTRACVHARRRGLPGDAIRLHPDDGRDMDHAKYRPTRALVCD